ncbi:hypothetical protein LOK49_LG08G01170 [Camellia lanceoleosa]|uniref:Uncharacterized protein n=1 Tax=Camellia lanceoleosa TaxID=1840588 RepID=A0ACC0GXS5_9ERIC|nr:hypothetical protein LOK49_LG08G01170 [Camellia lanceoleosa]
MSLQIKGQLTRLPNFLGFVDLVIKFHLKVTLLKGLRQELTSSDYGGRENERYEDGEEVKSEHLDAEWIRIRLRGNVDQLYSGAGVVAT